MLDDEVSTLIMSNDPDLIHVRDEAGTLLYANASMLSFFAPETRPAIVGSRLADHLGADIAARFAEEDRRALDLGRSDIVEKLVDHLGRERVFQTRRIVCRMEEGETRLLTIATEITELVERERSLVEANDKLKRFAAFAAHDLRSPLATYVSAMNVIKADRKTSLGPQSAQYLDLMIESAGNLADNVSAMLSVAQVDTNAAVEFAEADLNLVLEEVRFNLSSLVSGAGATISAARLPKIVCAAGLFRQLLQNLVENAVKNRSSESAHVLIRHEKSDGTHRFFVEDNGKGISIKAARTIFEPFDQGGKGAVDGAGIGLALCRRIVDLHHGDIRVDTSFETGCRIEVAVPVDPSGATPRRQVAA